MPSEEELENISRTLADGRRYPWGNELGETSASKVNWRGSGINGVSPPGTFEADRKIVDFWSNVRCWTTRANVDGTVNWPPEMNSTEEQVVLGGSWADPELDLRASRPGRDFVPHERDERVGIRLVKDRN